MTEQISPAEIEAAKKGNEAAIAGIIAKQMPCIRRLARRAVRPGLDFDDAVQEGLIGLFRAMEQFDAEAGASFGTYATVCIQNAVLTASRAAGRKKHAPLNQSVPLSGVQSTPGPEEQTIASEQISLTLEKARKHLSDFEKSVLRLLLDGYTNAQIAQKLGKDTKAVENALLRARRKLK